MFTLSSDQELMVSPFSIAPLRAVLTIKSSLGFLKAMGEIYEVVVFTASLSKYADPVLDQLDIHRVVKHRLFRESCYNNKGNYVKVSSDSLCTALRANVLKPQPFTGSLPTWSTNGRVHHYR